MGEKAAGGDDWLAIRPVPSENMTQINDRPFAPRYAPGRKSQQKGHP